MRGMSGILSLFRRNEFNKFKYTGVRMLDSIYHLKSHLWHQNAMYATLLVFF